MGPEKPSQVTKTDARRTSKPLMEKKRRARINDCLTQLKSLVLEATKKETARYSKLEKADILEMTVRHLRSLHRQYAAVSVSLDQSVLDKYRAGYNQCFNEVTKFINSAEMAPDTRMLILNHLSGCLKSVSGNGNNNTQFPGLTVQTQQNSPLPVQVQTPNVSASPAGQISATVTQTGHQAKIAVPPLPEVNNNTSVPVLSPQNGGQTVTKLVGSLQFLPNTGEIALFLPAPGQNAGRIPVIPLYANTVSVPTSVTSNTAVSTVARVASETADVKPRLVRASGSDKAMTHSQQNQCDSSTDRACAEVKYQPKRTPSPQNPSPPREAERIWKPWE